MRIINVQEIQADNATYRRHINCLEIITPHEAHVNLYGETGRAVWTDVLRSACLEAGLHRDASIFEIRAYLEVREDA